MELLIYVGLMSAAGAMAVFRPAWVSGAALCMFGLDQFGQIASPWLLARQTFSNYAIGVIVLLGVLGKIHITRASVLRLEAGQLAILVLIFYAIASITWTPEPEAAWVQFAANAPYLLVLVVLAPLTVSTADDLIGTMWSVVSLGGVLSVALLSLGNWGSRGLLVSPFSPAETNPLALAILGGIVALAAFSLLPSIRRPIPALLASVSGVAGMLLTLRSGSRGELFALIPLILLVGWLCARPAGRLRQGFFGTTLVVAVVGVTAYYGVSIFVQADDSRWTSAVMAADASSRMEMAGNLLNAWSSGATSFLFGLGNAAAFDPRIIGFYPHNMPLEVLCEEGLLGFTILLVVLTYAANSFFTLHRRYRGEREREDGPIVFVGILVAFALLLSLKEGSLFGSAYLFFGCVVLFRLRALRARPRPQRWQSFANVSR